MSTWKLKIHQGDCGICDLCALACSTAKFGVQHPKMSAIKISHRGEGKDHKRLESSSGILPCWHCDDPPCLPACPYNAMSIDEHNVVSIHLSNPPEGKDICIACMKCVKACEEMHGVPSIFVSPIKDREMKSKSGRDILKYSLYKCDMCGGDPACVKICPRNAIEFVET